MSPKKILFEFNYERLHHAKITCKNCKNCNLQLVKIFQQYCHLHFAEDISMLR